MENLLEFPFAEVSAVGGSQLFHGNVDQSCTDHVSHADETLLSRVSQVRLWAGLTVVPFGVLWRSFKPRTQSLSAVLSVSIAELYRLRSRQWVCFAQRFLPRQHMCAGGAWALHALLGSIPLGCWLWTLETNSFHCSWILKSFTCSFFTPENLKVKHAGCFSLSDLFDVPVEVRSAAFCRRWQPGARLSRSDRRQGVREEPSGVSGSESRIGLCWRWFLLCCKSVNGNLAPAAPRFSLKALLRVFRA